MIPCIQHKGFTKDSGQALTMLLVFVTAGIIITTAAVTVALLNYQTAGKIAQGDYAYFLAESGAENALIRLLRDSTYTGETLPVGADTVTISVTGTSPKVITSTGVNGTVKRTIEVQVTLTSTMSIVSWKELP